MGNLPTEGSPGHKVMSHKVMSFANGKSKLTVVHGNYQS